MSNDKLVDLENRIVQRLAWLREGSLIDVQAFTADIEAMLAQAHAAEAKYVPDEAFCMEAMNADNLRGYDYAVAHFNDALKRVLDKPHDRAGVCYPEWQALRERIWALQDKAAEAAQIGADPALAGERIGAIMSNDKLAEALREHVSKILADARTAGYMVDTSIDLDTLQQISNFLQAHAAEADKEARLAKVREKAREYLTGAGAAPYRSSHAAEAAHTRIPDLTDDEWMILFHERPDLKDRLNAIFDQAAYLSRYRSQCKTSTEAAQPLPQMTDAEHAEILAKYGTAQPAEPAKDARAPDFIDLSFEVWQHDEMVASCSGPEPQALTEATHYASQYAQDGPVSVFRVSRVRIDTAKEFDRDNDA